MKVLFLCLGNICRSPMAEAVFRNMVDQRGLSDKVWIDSAGLGGWHVGEPPHSGTIKVLDKHNISSEGLVSRQIQSSDLGNFDYIVAMDEANIQGLQRLGVTESTQVFKLLELVPEIPQKDVPDPYYTGNFDEVYRLIHVGCERLLDTILSDINA